MEDAIVPGLDLDRAALDRARISRDARFDGRFYIAVLSTRIYCRPICPAPSPKPANVRYYPSAAAAAEAGFRPCLRCRPEAAPASPAWLGVSAVVRRALRLIDEGALDEASVSTLAERLGIGERHLRRLFVQHVGASPVAVAQTRRLHFAKRLIDETDFTMTEVALASGYGSVRRFNAAFRSTYGRAPSDLRRRRRGQVETSGDRIVLRLAYRPPYDWQAMRRYLAARAVAGLEHVDDASYARTMVLEGEAACVVIRSPAQVDAIELTVHGASARTLFSLVTRARRVFDLSVDPCRINGALQRHPVLAPLVHSCPGLRIPGVWDAFECAVRAVLSDGHHAREQIFVSRLVSCCGTELAASLVPGMALTRLFPSADELLRRNPGTCGFSTQQVALLTELAAAVVAGSVDFNAPAEELAPALRRLAGISDWMVEYILLRALGEPDAFPAPDGSRRMRPGRGSPGDARSLSGLAESWRPWRGYAALHLECAAHARKGGTSAAVASNVRDRRFATGKGRSNTQAQLARSR